MSRVSVMVSYLHTQQPPILIVFNFWPQGLYELSVTSARSMSLVSAQGTM
jgi:hypothetical protein